MTSQERFEYPSQFDCNSVEEDRSANAEALGDSSESSEEEVEDDEVCKVLLSYYSELTHRFI